MARNETMMTHQRKASMARSNGSRDHGEVAAVVPGGDEVLDGAQEVTGMTMVEEDARGFPTVMARGGWRSRPWQ
jgi:hypothetical protein